MNDNLINDLVVDTSLLPQSLQHICPLLVYHSNMKGIVNVILVLRMQHFCFISQFSKAKKKNQMPNLPVYIKL